jgi:hypothetical protein
MSSIRITAKQKLCPTFEKKVCLNHAEWLFVRRLCRTSHLAEAATLLNKLERPTKAKP